MTISLILAESALETVPPELYGHPAVRSHAARRRTGTGRSRPMLLDVSWHYAAMKGMSDAGRRGRPDLVHLALVTAMSAPIYRVHESLEVYVHTADCCVIHVGSGVRMPKSYHRFAGLIEELYETGAVTAHGKRDDKGSGNTSHGSVRSDKKQETLLRLERGQSVAGLVRSKQFSRVVGLSTRGMSPDCLHPCEFVARRVCDYKGNGGNGSEPCNKNPAIVVGGFQKGHFADETSRCFDEMYSIDPSPLESHVVIARILYECEKKPFM